jgi:hypothetical protein
MRSRHYFGLRPLAHTGIVFALAALLSSCDNSKGSPTDPTPPNPTPADLFRGTAGIIIPAIFEEKCSPKTPPWGFQPPTVLAQGTITRDGSGWIWRIDSSRGGGTLQINFSSTGMTDTELTLNGTAQGTVVDMLSALRFPNPDRLTVGGAAGPATVTGTFNPRLSGLQGQLTGTLAFTDNQGGVTTCSETLLLLSVFQR